MASRSATWARVFPRAAGPTTSSNPAKGAKGFAGTKTKAARIGSRFLKVRPFEGFRWRTIDDLKANYVWLYLYITDAPAGHVSRVWFDDMVIATDYIGPISAGMRSGRFW